MTSLNITACDWLKQAHVMAQFPSKHDLWPDNMLLTHLTDLTLKPVSNSHVGTPY